MAGGESSNAPLFPQIETKKKKGLIPQDGIFTRRPGPERGSCTAREPCCRLQWRSESTDDEREGEMGATQGQKRRGSGGRRAEWRDRHSTLSGERRLSQEQRRAGSANPQIQARRSAPGPAAARLLGDRPKHSLQGRGGGFLHATGLGVPCDDSAQGIDFGLFSR